MLGSGIACVIAGCQGCHVRVDCVDGVMLAV